MKKISKFQKNILRLMVKEFFKSDYEKRRYGQNTIKKWQFF